MGYNQSGMRSDEFLTYQTTASTRTVDYPKKFSPISPLPGVHSGTLEKETSQDPRLKQPSA